MNSSEDEDLQSAESANSDETIAYDPLSESSSPRGSDGHEGRRIGRYRLLSVLGEGGQGAVYLAEDERLRRKVALKVLFGGLVHSAEARLRFEREAEATGRLNHPGIAKIYEMDEVDGVPFIAMELIEGESLAARLKEASSTGPNLAITSEVFFDFESDQPEKSATSKAGDDARGRTTTSGKRLRGVAHFIESVADALQAAHESGLIHRDIKPGNIMVRPDESPCVLDFGLAHDEESASVTLTGSRDRFGTPAYMAPEQVRGHVREIDCRTDVWALGVTLYECCTLTRPFEAPTLDGLFEQIKKVEPRPPRDLNPGIPKDLEAIILTAIDKDQGRRYATAERLAEDLRRFRRNEPVLARPAGALVKTTRWLQRNRILTAAVLVIILALSATSAIFIVKEGDAQRALRAESRERRAKEAALADRTAALRERSKALAERTKALNDYDRFADVKRLEAAAVAANELYPPGPELIPAILDWQKTHGVLAERLPLHEAFLEELRAKAKPAEGEKQGEERKTWRFENQALQFQHDVLAKLVINLRRFSDPKDGVPAIMVRLLDRSRNIALDTVEGDSAELWDECRKRMASNPLYAGVELDPQVGLIPLGPDPESKLEEFLHYLTNDGKVISRDPETGKLPVTEKSGLVFVLIPGGTHLMGAQKEDPTRPNYDPGAFGDEQLLHEIELQPFLISKYEMTQGQWGGAFQRNPSQYPPGWHHAAFKHPMDRRHPVERVSWETAKRLLPASRSLYRARRNGSVLHAEVRITSTPVARRSPSFRVSPTSAARRRGESAMSDSRRGTRTPSSSMLRSARSRPMVSACMTCREMSGSGASTACSPTPRKPGSAGSAASRRIRRIASTEAAATTTRPSSHGSRGGAAPIPISRTRTSA